MTFDDVTLDKNNNPYKVVPHSVCRNNFDCMSWHGSSAILHGGR